MDTEKQVFTETEEDIKVEALCHLFPATNGVFHGFSYCGVPRCEQPIHGALLPKGSHKSFICLDCGLRRCEKCRRAG